MEKERNEIDVIIINTPVLAGASVRLAKLPVPEEPIEVAYREKALTAIYNGVVNRPVTRVLLSTKSGYKMKALALWDTGAVNSCVSESALKKLDSSPVDADRKCCILAPNNMQESEYHKLEMEIPGVKKYQPIMVARYDFLDTQNIDVLIGMDIISDGRFVIDTKSGNTQLSFELNN